MRFRFPRLRRRGSAVPAYPGALDWARAKAAEPYPWDSDTVRVTLSPGRHAEPIPAGYRCTTCGNTHNLQAELPHAKAMNWFMQHHCEPPGPIEEIGASLPAVDTLDARICPQCRRKDVKHISYVEPDLETWAANRDDVLGLIRDTMEIEPCECRINLRRWGLHGYQYSDAWTAWEWRRQ